MFNDPLLLAALVADRRADLQRAAAPWRATPTNTGRRRLRRLVAAVVRRLRRGPHASGRDELGVRRDPQLQPVPRPIV
jgi:hypothetical protein